MSDDSKRWTTDARLRQSEVCRTTQPWKHSKPEPKRRFVHEALHDALAALGAKPKAS